MAETLDLNDRSDPRVHQHELREARQKSKANETAKAAVAEGLSSFSNKQLKAEITRRQQMHENAGGKA